MRVLTTLLLLSLGVAQAVRPGDVAPNFSLKTEAGKTVSLNSLRGEPVVLTFWATWCLVCKEELPELNQEARAAKLKNMYAVSATDSAKDALAYFRKNELGSVTPLVDAPGTKGTSTAASVARAYRIIGQPVSVFIDKAGKVSAVHSGYMPPEQFRVYLKTIQTP
ncbi:TlpA family protein disulfide reductase [Deinococcus peraridilitoris]|uniref:Thiol-disulfide isomerase-like thioredoxin n=1 Tax=Deinococcus peraridilitoris (strain DSM 19664 / LMG 22246 / CIP 109416 / KR-200) TaxID=937777 RepID=K9ZZA0_DEIPD|nr:TlpA disulfide reductase family protein [Deinococcus peraridilitoris]AFZ66247.1 thiol-disulfide isomerase-like thioredoxin [Deinococcus peraridilitoris DSM 19664]